MSGVTNKSGTGAQAEALIEREQLIKKLLEEGVPKQVIAARFSMEEMFGRKECNRIIQKYDINYQSIRRKPTVPDVGLTPENHKFRYRLAHELQIWRTQNKLHPNAVQNICGIAPREQTKAIDHYGHDWRLAQMEQLAKAMGITCKDLILKCVLDENEYAKVIACLKKD